MRAMHRSSGIEVRVEYRILPGEDIGALMRRVTIRNTGCDSITFRLADGMARIIPAGIRNTEFREMSNLLKSYFDAEIHESGAALFSSRSTTENTARVGAITRRNFYFASSSGRSLKLVCDPTQLFGPDTGLGWPSCFSAQASTWRLFPRTPAMLYPAPWPLENSRSARAGKR